MRKFIRKLLFRLMLLFLCAAAIVAGWGYIEYRRAIAKAPISEKVSEYWSKAGYVAYDGLDTDFVQAVVSAEDKRFFSRRGIDYAALLRAVISDLYQRRLAEGGSTISQQIAKNLYFDQSDLTLGRKAAEIYLMLDLEKDYTKNELFALYVNMNYYGDGYWGIAAAARGYYHCSASNMTIAQAAMLAGIPNAPAVYQLSTGHDLAKKRQERILKNMLDNGYISKDQYAEALAEAV